MNNSEVFKLESIQSRKENREGIKARMWAIIEAYEKNLVEKREREIRRQDKQTAMKLVESRLKNDISQETLEDGKKRYSNQEQRDTALDLRLARESEWLQAQMEYLDQQSKLNELNDTMEILKLKFKAIQAEVSLEQMEV